MSADQFLQYLLAGLSQGSVYALVGLGFTIIYAVTRIINFAQGEFVMLGGMLSFTLGVSAGLPLAVAAILSIVITAIIGAIMYLLAIRTAKRASVISLIIITIGASIFIRGIAGTFILISLALGVWVSPWWLLFTAFVGLNLLQSSITGWCLGDDILRKIGVKSEAEIKCAEMEGTQTAPAEHRPV